MAAAAYIVVTNTTPNVVSLSGIKKTGESYYGKVPASGTLNINLSDLIGNSQLCSEISTFLTAGTLTGTRGGVAISTADMTYWGSGADMNRNNYDADDDKVVDAAETVEMTNTTSVLDTASPYTVLTTDKVLLVDTTTTPAALELDLPAAATFSGKTLRIIDVGGLSSNALTVDPNGTEELDGSNASRVYNTDYLTIDLFCNGTAWFSLTKNADMAKEIYDADDDGVVDAADILELSNATSVLDTASPYTVLTTDTALLCDTTTTPAALTLNIPAAATFANQTLLIKDVAGGLSANALTIDPNGVETLDGSAASLVVGTDYASITLYCDGTEWFSIEKTNAKPGQALDYQAAAATATTVTFIAPGPGQLVYAAAQSTVGPGAGESMTFDITINGVSALTGTFVLDQANGTAVLAGTIDTAANAIAAGDLVRVVRTYVAGAAAMTSTWASIGYELF